MQKTLYNLTSYLLYNAYSLKSIGIYNGKAGLSLSLFETARYLQDESIEEHAFELLQESLVLGENEDDLTFENGISGIGFVLLYLIQNQFIDASFDELFGEYAKRIVSVVKKETTLCEKLFPHIHFLALLYEATHENEVYECILKIRKAKEESLKQQIRNPEISKFQFLTDFMDYLRMVSNHRYPVSESLVREYAGLYQKNKFASRFEIAFYLERLIEQKQIENCGFMDKIIKANKSRALQNIKNHPDQFPLAAQIDLLYLFHQNPGKYKSYMALLEKDLFVPDLKDLQKNLLRKIPPNKFIPAYEAGIARFLLYAVYTNLKKEGKEAARFISVLQL
ncbi:MAG: hypothetical protein LIO93_02660 [Bacteroidales bacterium]|nr:hypothetical protein [Bacteroidales bacterium]